MSADERGSKKAGSGSGTGLGAPQGSDGYASDFGMGSGMGSGPNLGTMLRPPFRKAGVTNLVFGRSLAGCVRDTKPLVVLGPSDVDLGREGRFIPALVLRCIQHIERWGIEEEGIFRYVVVLV